MKTVRVLCQECFRRTGAVLAEPPDEPSVTNQTSERDAPSVEITAKPCEWRMHVDGTEWHDDRYGFFVQLEPEEDRPYCASWGEDDAEQFSTLAEAQAWCQSEIDHWIAKHAALKAAQQPAPPEAP